MRKLWGFCLAFGLVHSTAFGLTVRTVYKGSPKNHRALKRMTFGLSATQTQKILDLTQGRVNFGDVYYEDHPAAKLRNRKMRAEYSGTLYPNVPPPVKALAVTADPELTNEWWITRLGVREAWKFASGQGVTIADCDAGYYHDESDLHANLLLNERFDFGNPDDPYTVNDGEYAFHGTAVAAIMAGVLDGAGTNGIAYNSKVVPLQNYNYDEKLDKLDKEEATVKCILHAIKTPNVNIIVLENQTETGSSETFVGTRDAVRLAIQAGIIIVGAAGNSSVKLIEEERDDTGSIIVGALTYNGSAASFTNYGSRNTVGAYGEYLRTLYGPNGKFDYFGGTSGATPQVAATVALMLEVNPFLTPPQVRAILQKTRELYASNAKAGGKLRTDLAVAKARELVPILTEFNRSWLFRRQLVSIL